MDASFAIHAVVLNVLGPGLALNVDEHTRGRLGEVHKNERRQITGLVGEGEVLEVNAILRVVVDGTDVLLVGRVLKGTGTMSEKLPYSRTTQPLLTSPSQVM